MSRTGVSRWISALKDLWGFVPSINYQVTSEGRLGVREIERERERERKRERETREHGQD